MHLSPRSLRSLLAPAIVGLHALALVSCESTNPLQPKLSPSDAASRYESQYGVHFVTITTTDSSLTTGQQTQATGIPRGYYGEPILEAPVTWSIAPTDVATIDSTGLITAGDSSGTATVSATSDGQTRSMTITVTGTKTSSSSGAPVHMISISANATSLDVGEVTQVSGVVRDVNGTAIANVPITWSTSPTSVATVSTTNATSGVLTAVGAGTATLYATADTVTRSITITVADTAADSSGTAGQVPMGASGASYGSATPAELPRVSVNTTYPTPLRQIRVPAGGSLQKAIDAAQAGDEILLAPGAVFTGNFYLRNKGVLNGWITIRTDLSDAAIGYAGTRMTPSRAAAVRLAKIVTPNIYSAITTELGANHYRFTGVEFAVSSSVVDMNALVRLGDNTSAQNSAAATAGYLVFDRTYIHGNPTGQLKRCVMMNSATTAIVDSWLGNCHSNVSDSQAIVGWNGPGPYLIQNNHLEAGHEVIMFGGGGVTVQNVSPSDITIRGNHIMRPASWKGVWQVKNLVESKHARRMLIEGNVIENTWADAQAGFAFVLKSENQYGDTPWTQTTDVTIRYNRIRNVGNGFNIAARGSSAQVVPGARFVITDNVMENVGVSPYVGDGRDFQLLPGVSDVVLMHNTVVSANGWNPASIYLAGSGITRLVVHSNILHHGRAGVKGDATGEGTASLSRFAPGYLYTNNAMTNGGTTSAYPANNYFPSLLSNLGFVSLSGGNYLLSSTSAYLNKGYDGRNIGADIAKVTAMTKGAVVAP
jgi:hypothetical protein